MTLKLNQKIMADEDMQGIRAGVNNEGKRKAKK
jgi:hypothetical protein